MNTDSAVIRKLFGYISFLIDIPARLIKGRSSNSIHDLFVFLQDNSSSNIPKKEFRKCNIPQTHDAAMICFPRFVTFHQRVQGILAIN
jgi:hypothetical protein